MKWLEYDEWVHFKKWYKEMEIEAIKQYMATHPGILAQVLDTTHKVEPLTLEVLDQFLLDLSKNKVNNEKV
jgi:hypothetical protein